FHEDRIREQSGHGTGVREGEEAIRHRAAVRARIPGLQKRTGGREQEVRETDSGGEESENAVERIVATRRFPANRGDDGKDGEAHQEQGAVDQDLALDWPFTQEVRPAVASQQCELEEEHATGPDGRRAAEPG